LRSYVDSARARVEAEAGRFSDVYRDFSFEAEGDSTLVYTYTYQTQVVPAQARASIESGTGTLQTYVNDVIFPEMRSVGVDRPAAKWIYLNSDGTLITTIEVAADQG
jgi:hypothetical protein